MPDNVNSYVYTYIGGFTGTDSLKYIANDEYEDSNTAKVTLDVTK